jgi:hypothetical protein
MTDEERGADVRSVSWWPDGQYLASTGPADPVTGTELEVFQVSGLSIADIPVLGREGLMVLAILLALSAIVLIRHRA